MSAGDSGYKRCWRIQEDAITGKTTIKTAVTRYGVLRLLETLLTVPLQFFSIRPSFIETSIYNLNGKFTDHYRCN